MSDHRNSWLATAVVAALVGGIAGFGAARWQGPQLNMGARPRIAVLSYAAALKDEPAEKVSAKMAALDAKARKLGAAGFVVLNDNAVVASPSGLQIPARAGDE